LVFRACKKFAAPFVGAPVRPNMPKSAAGWLCDWRCRFREIANEKIQQERRDKSYEFITASIMAGGWLAASTADRYLMTREKLVGCWRAASTATDQTDRLSSLHGQFFGNTFHHYIWFHLTIHSPDDATAVLQVKLALDSARVLCVHSQHYSTVCYWFLSTVSMCVYKLMHIHRIMKLYLLKNGCKNKRWAVECPFLVHNSTVEKEFLSSLWLL